MERSRQSARECRARKKLRYQYLSDLVQDREQAVEKLQTEFFVLESWAQQIDRGTIPVALRNMAQCGVGNGVVPGSSTLTSIPQAVPLSIPFEQTPTDQQFSSNYLSDLFEQSLVTTAPPTTINQMPSVDTMTFFRLP